MCDDCRRVEAKDTWNASVQVNQQFLGHSLRFLKDFLSNFLTTGAAKGRPEEDALLPRAAAHQVRGHQGVLRHPAQRRGARLLLRIGVGGQGRTWSRLKSLAYYFICTTLYMKGASILHYIVSRAMRLPQETRGVPLVGGADPLPARQEARLPRRQQQHIQLQVHHLGRNRAHLQGMLPLRSAALHSSVYTLGIPTIRPIRC